MVDELLKAAIDITKAQAAVREMKPDEVQEYLQKTHGTLEILSGNHMSPLPVASVATHVGDAPENGGACDVEVLGDPMKSIKERVICCLICQKEFKMLTKKHLASHGLTRAEYLERYNFPKGTKLVCRKIQKERRAKMKDMKLWERKGNPQKKADAEPASV